MFPNPIHLTGSTAFQPVIQAMAAQLNTRTNKITLIYQGSGSCPGASSVVGQTALTGTALYFPTATTTANCSLDAVVPSPKADVGISDVFYETCGVGARPTAVGDFPGPAQAMLFVVPSQATNAPTTITAEEAQNVWGCGARGMISPWTVETAIQQRNSGSGTQNVVARAINVLASSFHGTMNAGGGNVIATLTQTGTPSIVIANLNTAVGFLAADAYDANRSTLKSMAFRGLEQTQAYYADSSATTFDKRNVRDGRLCRLGLGALPRPRRFDRGAIGSRRTCSVSWPATSLATDGTWAAASATPAACRARPWWARSSTATPLSPIVAGMPAPAAPMVAPGQRVSLEASWSADAVETFAVYDIRNVALSPQREAMRVSWFATAGAFEHDVSGRAADDPALTADNEWVAPATAVTAHLWLTRQLPSCRVTRCLFVPVFLRNHDLVT